VYGGQLRDYIFIAAAIFVIGYVTVSYKAWAAGRDKYRHEQESAFSARRRAVMDKITSELGGKMAELGAAGAQAGEYIKASTGSELAAARSRLQQAVGPLEGLRKEYEELTKRLSSLASAPFTPFDTSIRAIERQAAAFRDRLEPHIALLRAELVTFHDAVRSLTAPAQDGHVYCISCGRMTPEAPYCQHCGSARAAIRTCPECHHPMVVPVHLLEEKSKGAPLFCTHCGTRLPSIMNKPAE
jgi:hypothetical protein